MNITKQHRELFRKLWTDGLRVSVHRNLRVSGQSAAIIEHVCWEAFKSGLTTKPARRPRTDRNGLSKDMKEYMRWWRQQRKAKQ